jgi:hypothetical protein
LLVKQETQRLLWDVGWCLGTCANNEQGPPVTGYRWAGSILSNPVMDPDFTTNTLHSLIWDFFGILRQLQV